MPATDEYVRSPKTMHRVFAASAVLMFVAFMWMMAADQDDEWRDYQRTFYAIQAAEIAQGAELQSSGEYEMLITSLASQEADAQEELDKRKGELDELKERQKLAAHEFDMLNREVKSTRARRDVVRANLDLATRDALSEEDKAPQMAEFEELQDSVREKELELEQAKTELDNITAQITSITARRDKAAERLAQAQKELKQKEASYDEINPEVDGFFGMINVLKREIMEWPIIDGFNSHMKVQQDWLPGLNVKLGMTSSARFDRCGTCHLGIDKVLAGNVPQYPHADTSSHHDADDVEAAHSGEDYKQWVANNAYPHPYSTHPNPDLYVTATSPHKREKFGCTVCHEGQGTATSFHNASHGPDDPIQEHEWAKKYGYFDNHFWEYPMLPKRFQESHCIKCHHNVVELGVHPKFGASAPKVYRGYELIRQYGCFGCHEISGFAGSEPVGPDLRLEPQTEAEAAAIAADPNQVAGKMRKVGPSLRHIASKVDRGWMEHWTSNPKNFRPTTKMPRFFGLSNQQDELAHDLQPVEIAAVTQFLLGKSTEFEYLSPKEGYTPDAERGKTLFSQKGCLACHSQKDFPAITADFGPNLDRVHEKLPAGKAFPWLYSWIKEPTRYHARTKMPDLYLDPYKEGETEIDPAADIAAYLLKGGPQKWEPLEVNDEDLDRLVALFLKGKVLTTAQYDTFMDTRDLSLGGELLESNLKGDEIELWTEPGTELTDEEWKERRLNFVGRRTVSRYGCYGCHDISGFESARPIGVALLDWGRKERAKLAPEHIAEFMEVPVTHFEIVPLQESDDVKEILAEIETYRDFFRWIEERKDNEEIARKPYQEVLQADDYSSTLGKVERLYELAPGTWTQEPIETESGRYLVLAAERESMAQRVEHYLHEGETDSFATPEEREKAMSIAYFYQSLLHHGRAGFLWQKLRQPRSYDYEKIETKGYDERLRMPKFPFEQDDIEAIATFVLGLVAEPPAEEYLYRPTGPAGDRIAGEALLTQFNCTACHVLENPEYGFQIALDDLPTASAGEPVHSAEAMGLLKKLMEPTRVSLPGHVTEFPISVAGEMSDVIDDLGETPEGWEKFITAPGSNAAERVKAIGYEGDSEPAEWEFYVTLWENLLVERQEMSGPILHLQAQNTSQNSDRHIVRLSPDNSINAELILDLSNRTLSVKILGEDLEEILPAERVTLALDLISGQKDFELEKSDGLFKMKETDRLADEIRTYADLHGTVKVKFADVHVTPSSRMGFVGDALQSYKPGRGGDFTRWLLKDLLEQNSKLDGKVDNAWNMVAPPLVREGEKVQTPWLYHFLQNPEKLRYLSVLRMPKFNMSPAEAQILANYFAAVEETEYPYQQIPQREPPYLNELNEFFQAEIEDKKTESYLGDSWQMFMRKGNVCIGCHSVAGREYVSSAKPGELEVRGPNLNLAQNRLQPDWTLMWIYYPKWFTPYTKMPVNYPLDKPSIVPLFNKNPAYQTQAVRDALMNHARLMESQGVKIWEIPKAEGDAPAAETTEKPEGDN